MLGLQVDLELVDGTKHALDITWGIGYRWQQAHPEKRLDQAIDQFQIDQTMHLIWEAAKTHGVTTKPLHQFVDDVKDWKVSTPKEKPTT